MVFQVGHLVDLLSSLLQVLPIIVPCICAGIMACVGLYRMNVKGEEVS